MTVAPDILKAFRDYDREITIRKTRLGTLLGIILVPAFSVLDYLVFDASIAKRFLVMRVLCAVLMAVQFPLFGSRVGRKYYQFQGVALLTLVALLIGWMIYATKGAASPYYAGLNLALLMLAVVLDWTFWQALTAITLILAIYLTSCLAHGSIGEDAGIFWNNCTFLISSGVVITIGSYFHSTLRLREFVSRYELDKSRHALADQNKVLEDTLKQLKETELQLLQTEKIVSLGRLSAGIIHEINNPLNFAATGIYILKNQGERLAKDEPKEFTEVLRDVEDGLTRVKNIVSDLRSFTHPDAEQREIVRLTEVVTSSLRFLSNEWKDKVQIEQSVPADLVCRANRNKLTQVFVNIIQNSLDALKHKADAEPPLIRIAGHREEGKIVISVRDNGEGIEPQNLARIFDPFFTTRDVGEGMGMGLSICYRIIQELHGNISVTSERGKFCDFTIELPADASESMAA
jgi:two-component system sensor histidine kinase PhcS